MEVSLKNVVLEDALTLLSYAAPYPVTLKIQKPAEKSSASKFVRTPSCQTLNRSQSLGTLNLIDTETSLNSLGNVNQIPGVVPWSVSTIIFSASAKNIPLASKTSSGFRLNGDSGASSTREGVDQDKSKRPTDVYINIADTSIGDRHQSGSCVSDCTPHALNIYRSSSLKTNRPVSNFHELKETAKKSLTFADLVQQPTEFSGGFSRRHSATSSGSTDDGTGNLNNNAASSISSIGSSTICRVPLPDSVGRGQQIRRLGYCSKSMAYRSTAGLLEGNSDMDGKSRPSVPKRKQRSYPSTPAEGEFDEEAAAEVLRGFFGDQVNLLEKLGFRASADELELPDHSDGLEMSDEDDRNTTEDKAVVDCERYAGGETDSVSNQFHWSDN